MPVIEKNIIYECLTFNQFFRVSVKIRISPYPGTYVSILRRDTLEVYKSFISKTLDKDALTIETNQLLSILDKPIDWKCPHRYCIAFYSRLTEEDDLFRYELYDNDQDSKKIWHYMLRRNLKETILVRKINRLSFDERCQLLTIKNWELENDTNIRVGYGIFGRGYLYKRLFDKQGLSYYYQIYLQEIEKYKRI